MDQYVFVRSLLDDPSDRTTALVFADWLEERGEPRGEFLRIQSELATWVPELPRREWLQRREKELLDQHADRWLGLLRTICSSWRFRQGVVDVTLDGSLLASSIAPERVSRMFREAWVRTVRLTRVDGRLKQLVERGHLADVPALDLSGLSMDDRSLEPILTTRALPRLRSLNLGNNRLTTKGLEKLTPSPLFSPLRILDLRNNDLSGIDSLMGKDRHGPWVDLHGNPLAAVTIDDMTRAKRHRLERPGYRVNGLGMVFSLIPEGTFWMGCSHEEEGCAEGEGPRHAVTLTRPFYLSTYAVTQREYSAVMGHNPSAYSYEGGGGPIHPVENVSWHQAFEFCEQLSELSSEKERGHTYRLPFEAEWEHACRGGDTLGAPFSTGPRINNGEANFNAEIPYGGSLPGGGLGHTTPVGLYPAGPFGLYDMHGNVWEWCLDWYDPSYYSHSPGVDPEGPANSPTDELCARGGAFFSQADHCRCASRGRFDPNQGHNGLGFRVILEVSE